jgi:hypothetical protein
VIFRPELAEKILADEKTVTRRLCSENPRSPWWREKCALQVGRDYAVQKGRGGLTVCRVVIDRVDRDWLGYPDDHEAHLEGFENAREFVKAFKAINGQYSAAAEVWRVEFRLREAIAVAK